MKRIFALSAALLALAFEIMPYGAVCNFATPPGEPPLRLTYSYFSLIPFGYAHFSPFIVAMLTCALTVMLFVYFFVGQRMRKPILIVAAAAALLSLAPLLLGISYYSLVGALITVCLIIATVLVLLDKKMAES
ncbi:MAG: hypothetical protein IKB28_01130 [Clostridia bacterium]|nr:hypothetical protein [Clostridia bacterium]MBR2445251.1 hypothetical protein [Clostridia bacterium]